MNCCIPITVVNPGLLVVRSATRVVRSASPRVRSAGPRVRSASPRVRSASPRVRSASPRVRSAGPRVRSASPLVGSATPLVRSATPLVGSARPVVNWLSSGRPEVPSSHRTSDSCAAFVPSPLYSRERARVIGLLIAFGSNPSPQPSPLSTGERDQNLTSLRNSLTSLRNSLTERTDYSVERVGGQILVDCPVHQRARGKIARAKTLRKLQRDETIRRGLARPNV